MPCGKVKGKAKEEEKEKDGPKDRARSVGLWTIGPRNAPIIKEERKEAKARTEAEKEKGQPLIRSKQGLLGIRTMDSEDSRVIAIYVA